MLNYPANDGHALAEIFADGQWRLYDPTYATFYIEKDNPQRGALSYHDVRQAFLSGAPKIKQEVFIYRPGIEGFTGKDIFQNANPAGISGPSHPMLFPLNLDLNRFPILDEREFGPRFQGASFIGAASTNQHHDWVVTGLTPGAHYSFIVFPKHIGGDIESSDKRDFVLTAKIDGNEQTHIFNFSNSAVEPWKILFKANGEKATITLSHQYSGPKFRYMVMKSFAIEPAK